MSANKRPSTSSLRRFITSRPYVTVAELRRRFGLDEPDAIAHLHRNGTSAWIGLPDREATKVQELWQRDELGLELSVEVRAPVVVGIYPMRIARYVVDGLRNDHVPTQNGVGAHPLVAGQPQFGSTQFQNGAAQPQNGIAQPHNGAAQRVNGTAPELNGGVPALDPVPAPPFVGGPPQHTNLHDDRRS